MKTSKRVRPPEPGEEEPFDIRQALSYNYLMTMVAGGRGIKKTVTTTAYLLDQALAGRGNFFYVRRRPVNLGKSTGALARVFPPVLRSDEIVQPVGDDNFGRFEYYKLDKDGNPGKAKEIGYYVALSFAENLKSVDFSNVKYILYEEFLIEGYSSKYLRKEFDMFYSFLDTVIRRRDDVRVILLGNTTRLINPYFSALGITEKKDQHGKSWGVFFPKNKARTDESDDAFSSLLKESKTYWSYSVDASFDDDIDTLVKKRPAKAQPSLALKIDGQTYYSYVDSAGNRYFSEKGNPTLQPISYEVEAAKNNIMIEKNKIFRWLADSINDGTVFFDNAIVQGKIVSALGNVIFS